MSMELQFPPHCPNCGSLLLDSGSKHCTGRFCHWLKCVCFATIDQTGRYFMPPRRAGV